MWHAPKAVLFHKDKGGETHSDWVRFGEMTLINRYEVMTRVLHKRSPLDYLRLLYFELIYVPLTFAASRQQNATLRNSLSFLRGKLVGALKLVRGRSPHRKSTYGRPASE